MNNRLAVSLVAASLLASGAAFAQSTTEQGASEGARAGGDIGGPVGAMVGGTVGAAVGAGLEIPNAVITRRSRGATVRSWCRSASWSASRCRRAVELRARAEPHRVSLCGGQRSPRDRRAAHAQGDQDHRLIDDRKLAEDRVPAERSTPRGLFCEDRLRTKAGSSTQSGERRGKRKADAGGQRIDHEILQPGMPSRRPELQQFERAGQAITATARSAGDCAGRRGRTRVRPE